MPHDEIQQPAGGGFKETARYFENRARRARNEADQEHHLNAARFYRDLASITPALPPGYVPPKVVNRADRYRNRAEECRTIAAALIDAHCKRQLADLAVTYDKLAASCEWRDGEAVIRRSDNPERRDAAHLDRPGVALPR